MSRIKSHKLNGPVAVPVKPVDFPPLDTLEVYVERFLAVCDQLTATLQFVTPEMAKDWLATTNTQNRPMGSTWRKLKDAIGRGGWEITGECLIFATSGRLLNGQNRLQAIASGETAVPILIIRGVSEAAFKVMDRGKVRSNADVLSIEKHQYATTLASTLTWVARYEAPGGVQANLNREAVPPDLMLDLLARNPGLKDSVEYIATKGRSRRLPPGLAAFLHYEFSLRDADLASEFFLQVSEGIGVMPNTHTHLLVRRLDNDMSSRRTLNDQCEIAALTIKAWNRLVGNEPVGTILQWKTSLGEQFPEIKGWKEPA